MIDNVKLKLTGEEYLKISNILLKINKDENDCNYLIFYQKIKIETKFTKDKEKYIDVISSYKSKKVYIDDKTLSRLNNLYSSDDWFGLVPFSFMKRNNIPKLHLDNDLDNCELIFHNEMNDDDDEYENNIMLKYGKYKLIKFKKIIIKNNN